MSKEEMAGCYYCLKTFRISRIEKYIDDGETPLCPFCGIDSVLEGITCGAKLRNVHKKKFGNELQLYPKNKYGEK